MMLLQRANIQQFNTKIMINQVNKNCIIHKKICNRFCTYSKCQNKIICEKCVANHLKDHPKGFIYDIENLCTVHSLDKVIKLKEKLGKDKVYFQSRTNNMYSTFQNILLPLINRIRLFQQQSRQGLEKQIQSALLDSKAIIQNVHVSIKKSDTASIKTTPEVMIDQTIIEVNMIEITEQKLRKITMDLAWYTDATQQLCVSAQNQIHSMMKTTIQLMQNYKKIQDQRFQGKQTLLKPLDAVAEDTSFYNHYMTARQIIVEKDKMQNELIQSKKELDIKDLQVKNANMEMKQKQAKIDELFMRLSRKQEELRTWEQKASREERQKHEVDSKDRKTKQQYLIKNDIVSSGGHTINLMKKTLEDIFFPYIFGLIPNPVELQISQNYLTEYQKSLFHKRRSIQILKMSFMPLDKQFLSEALKNYEYLHTIQLNSAQINDLALQEISKHFPKSLKHIHLIDNKINDEGIDFLFFHFKYAKNLLSLYVSYNNLTPRSMASIKQYCENLKILHISKNPLKIESNKQLKPSPDIEELFIGGTGIAKDGFVALTKNFINLKRLSLVATQISTDIVSELLLGLEKLEWLDISYSNLTEQDKQKVEKLKIFNKLVEIVYQKA